MSDMALKGVKILDFTWVVTGPLVTKYLADYGATVIRVESSTKPDVMRLSPPYKDGITGIDRSGYFAFFNANKYGMSLNLSHPEGIDVVKKLLKWADAVVENFAPGVMERWGLGYQDLQEIKPDIIMLRCSIQGQTGPHSKHPGIGGHLVSFAGFTHFTGWADQEPIQPYGAYTDFIGPNFAVAALIAALLHRRHTGKGQCLDLSQYETAIHFLAPPILDYVVNGREGTRQGNTCPLAAPHSAYRCHGEDRWCVIAVFTDEQWQAFSRLLGNPEWTEDAKFSTLLARKKNEAELNKLVEAWTVNFTDEEVINLMQSAGVPAGVVETPKDLLSDRQLQHRCHLWRMEHKEIGNFHHMGQSFVLSKTPAKPRTPAPCLGEHTEYVCKQILGMSDKEFDELLAKSVFV